MDYVNDPFGIASTPFGGAARPRLSPAPLPDLPPEEQEGLLSRVGQSALGGLGYIGGTLDKALGGRAIRGLLGGRPEELLSIIPFSDKLGLTDEANAVSGKELLGFDPHDDSWGGTIGGMAAEMALDPATYLSFGANALTKTGMAAKKAGALPKGVSAGMRGLAANTPEASRVAGAMGLQAADVVDQPLRGLAQVRLPFTSDPIAVLGTGERAQKFADATGNLWDKIVYSKPGRAIAPLVDRRLSDFGPSPTTETGQRLVREASDALSGASEGVRKQFLGERGLAQKLGMLDPTLAPAANRELRGLMEGTTQLPSRIPEFNSLEVGNLLGDWRRELDDSLTKAAGVGRSAVSLEDEFANYFPRQLTPEGEAAVAREFGVDQKFLSSRNQNQLAREDVFKNIPGGTNALNDILSDPLSMVSPLKTVGPSLPKASANIRSKYFGWSPQTERELAFLNRDWKKGLIPETIAGPNGPVANPDFERLQELLSVKKQSRSLANIATGDMGDDLTKRIAAGEKFPDVWKDLTSKKTGLFLNNPLGEMATYRQANAKSNLAAKAFSDLVQSHATTKASDDSVSLLSVIDEGGYGNNNMKTLMLSHFKKKGVIPKAAGVQALEKIFVPLDVAEDAKRFGKVFAGPREINPILKAFDSATNLTKASQTTMLPFTIPTLLRNAATELYTNFIGGARNPNAGGIMGWIQPLLDAHSLRLGGELDNLGGVRAFQNAVEKIDPLTGIKTTEYVPLSAAEQTQRLKELMYQYGVDVPADKLEAASIVGKGSKTSDVGAGVIGPLQEPAKPVGEILKGAIPKSKSEANPLNIRGFGDRMETTFAPTKAAQELMQTVDDMGRKSAFIAYLQQGYDPAVAAAKAKAMRMDPQALTGFEQAVMKRLIPFYSWMRTAIPGMLSEVTQNPGGLVGQSIRATNDIRSNGTGLIPDYIGEGLALPLGGRDEQGNQRFLTGLGLPFEELGRIADNSPTAGGSLQRVLQKLLGATNPLIKGPLEFASGTQFYSGRNLDDLFDRTGFDQVLMNSPLGTVSRTASRFADPRKSVLDAVAGMVSPARINDADMNRARQIQGRRLLEEALRSNPDVRTFEQIYVPAEAQGRLTPQELQMLSLYQTLMQEARAANEARRAQAAQ